MDCFANGSGGIVVELAVLIGTNSTVAHTMDFGVPLRLDNVHRLHLFACKLHAALVQTVENDTEVD